MTEKKWILTDVDNQVWLEKFSASPSDVGLNAPGAGITRKVFQGGLADGVDLIEINNGKLSVSILPTRGMGLWKGSYNGLFLGWNSPVKGPVNPAYVNQVDRGGLGWLTGFDEWMCRCGLDSNGAPGVDTILNNEGNPVNTSLNLHGRIANIPAHYVEASVSSDNGGTLSVTGIVNETMLFGPCLQLKTTISTTLGSNRLVIRDEVVNLKGVPSELELLYHTNMGGPFLEKDAKVVAPTREVAPRDARAVEDIATYDTYLGPTTGYVEQCYWYDLLADKDNRTQVLLRNAHGDKGISLHFNKRELPCFTVWKNTQAEIDGYVTGLEPATNYPNLKTFERQQGRVVNIPPGGSYSATVEIQIHDNPHGVAEVEERINALQKTSPAVVHQKPHPKYTPNA